MNSVCALLAVDFFKSFFALTQSYDAINYFIILAIITY